MADVDARLWRPVRLPDAGQAEAVKQKVLTISLPAASAVGAEAAAEREGTSVSQWVADAIELRQRLEAGLDLLRRAEAEQGPPRHDKGPGVVTLPTA